MQMKEKNKEIYLRLIFVFGGIMLDRFWMKKLVQSYRKDIFELEKQKRFSDIKRYRYKEKWEILLDWKYLKGCKKTIFEWFNQNNYNNVAIYGLGELGELLVNEILNSTVNLKYIIDRDKNGRIYKNVPIISLNDTLEEVDLIIVTTVRNFEEIQEQLETLGDFKLIKLADLIKEIRKYYDL